MFKQSDIVFNAGPYCKCSNQRGLSVLLQGGPYITANLYRICLSDHETCAWADAVQICGNYETLSIIPLQ